MKTPIVFATDDGYAMPTSVAIASLVNHSSMSEIEIIVLYKDSLQEKSKKMINEAIKANKGAVKLRYIDVKDLIDCAFSHIQHISAATYYRILLPLLLPEYTQCLYLDGDIYANGDISELCEIELDKNEYVAGVSTVMIQTCSKKVQEERKRKLNIGNFNDYINAGVLLMNLELMRKNNSVQSMIDMIPKNFPVQDQDIINIISYKHTLLLPPKFNAMPCIYNASRKINRVYSKSDISDARTNPIIIHYADKRKPWKYCNLPQGDKWRLLYINLYGNDGLGFMKYKKIDKLFEVLWKIMMKLHFKNRNRD